jgi:hypothetical protein
MPPKGMAGLDRSLVKGINRSPFPPAMISARVFFIPLTFALYGKGDLQKIDQMDKPMRLFFHSG